ncbi:MAG TPA: hypothetical protein PK808_04430 [Polymorphobacter sp.]|jgi:hypothetical protein|nr:hypothetical protein [Polymorphobacter sp.]
MKPSAVFHATAIFAAVVLASAPALAAPDAAKLVGGLSGRWTGTLSYRDYTSNAPEKLPMVSEIAALPDGATVISINRFADGPTNGIVTITDVSLFDTDAAHVATATLRRGKPMATETSALQVARHDDALHWSIVYTRDGTDNNQPALIRVTQTRDGNTLTTRSEFQPKTPQAVWTLRSGTDLVRDGAAVPEKKR